MRNALAALAFSALSTMTLNTPATAQTVLDHRVQRAWDNVFDPPPPGDPRTNWERHRDNRRAAAWAGYCQAHPGAPDCRR